MVFLEKVKETLRKHVSAVNKHTTKGTYFFDYGNAFLLEASRAGADIMATDGINFRYPSYVQDIMGPMCFDYGFGPFRWVCASGKNEDLDTTDKIATEGRIKIALAFKDAIRQGKMGSVVLGRDHHDVSGTDSPVRETSNIYDGSRYTADMAIHNVIGDSFRGATWVSVHNGGGVGWREVINGGFGMLLDGTEATSVKIKSMLHYDVNNGIVCRAWAQNDGAVAAISRAQKSEERLKITMAHPAADEIIEKLF